jgi:hypothetical protein
LFSDSESETFPLFYIILIVVGGLLLVCGVIVTVVVCVVRGAKSQVELSASDTGSVSDTVSMGKCVCPYIVAYLIIEMFFVKKCVGSRSDVYAGFTPTEDTNYTDNENEYSAVSID